MCFTRRSPIVSPSIALRHRCMWSQDIEGSEAYAKALQKTGILTDKETEEICEGLDKVRAEWAAGEFKVVVSF